MTARYGKCPECGYSIRLRTDGTVGGHSFGAVPVCSGTGRRPVRKGQADG